MKVTGKVLPITVWVRATNSWGCGRSNIVSRKTWKCTGSLPEIHTPIGWRDAFQKVKVMREPC